MKRFVTFTLVIIAMISVLAIPANAAYVTDNKCGSNRITEQFEIRIERTFDPGTTLVDLIGRNEFAGYATTYYCYYYPEAEDIEFLCKCFAEKIEDELN